MFKEGKVAKKLYTCNDINLSHEQMLELQRAGHLNLGIDDSIATQIVSVRGIGPETTTASAAFHFWSWVAFGIFAYTVYLSFTSAWWWFIFGLIGMTMIWSANKKGNSQNLLDAALTEKVFYERIRYLGGWLYQIEESEAEKYI